MKYFIYFIVILVFFAISAYIIYTSNLFLYELLNHKICSKDSSLYLYLFACTISAYLFSIGNFFSIFIIGCHKFALFSELPACFKTFFVIYALISLFYGFTLYYNYTNYNEVNKIYNKIYHGFEKLLCVSFLYFYNTCLFTLKSYLIFRFFFLKIY